MNVLVIGGTGSIGPYVVRRLAQKSHRLTVFHRGKTPADLPPMSIPTWERGTTCCPSPTN